MPNTQAMLDTYPGTFIVDASLLAKTIDTIVQCANTCRQCADACLSTDRATELAKCIRLNLDCADICHTTSQVISRQTEPDANVTRSLLEACITVCKACGDICMSHAEQMEHCRVCGEECRRCEDACRQLLSALS